MSIIGSLFKPSPAPSPAPRPQPSPSDAQAAPAAENKKAAKDTDAAETNGANANRAEKTEPKKQDRVEKPQPQEPASQARLEKEIRSDTPAPTTGAIAPRRAVPLAFLSGMPLLPSTSASADTFVKPVIDKTAADRLAALETMASESMKMMIDTLVVKAPALPLLVPATSSEAGSGGANLREVAAAYRDVG